jgi:hypothetical protein
METVPPTLDDIFDQLCDFPWPIGAFSALKRYVRVVDEFFPHSTAQQLVRLTARIKSEKDPVAIGEFESEIKSLKDDASIALPRLVWGGVLVSINAAFEFGVESVFRHWQAVSDHPILFKQEPKKDFLSSARNYAKDQIGIQLFSTPVQNERLVELKQLRNSFVHKGGQLSTLSPKLKAKIENKVHLGLALEETNGQWVANARSAAFYLLTSEKVIQSFSELMVEKCVPQNNS